MLFWEVRAMLSYTPGMAAIYYFDPFRGWG
jgi:hypothetical protein